MQSPIVNEQQRHMLQALLAKGAMTTEQLTELCKNAFGWSTAVIRRAQKSLLKQGLIVLRDSLLTPAITKEDLENNLWDSRLLDTFERQSSGQPDVSTKQPFFKSVWFWTTCVALIVIAILSIALIQPFLPAATETDIPSQLLICKEALDQWQAQEALQLLHITEIPDVETPFTSYCFYEDDWMQLCWDPQNPYSTAHLSFMRRDGQLFISNNAVDVIHWTPTNLEYSDTPKPWPITFSWQNCKLYYLDTITSGKETLILFEIADLSAENAGTYEVTFIFDQSQNLKTIKVYTGPSDAPRCDTFHLQESDPIEIAKLFSESEMQNPNTAAPEIPEELQICKEALDQWQKLDAYQIICEYTRYGDKSTASESAEHTEYWQSGDNWIKIINYGSYSIGHLYSNGKLYTGTSDGNILIWVPELAALPYQPYVWPISFSWNDCDLLYKKTSKNPDETHIFFSVVVTDPEDHFYISSPYHVCFTFDKRNQLESISVAIVSSNADSSISATVSTYRLVSEDANAIAQYIDAQAIADSNDVPEEG